MQPPKQVLYKISLHLHISYLFVGLLLLFAAVSNWHQYRQSRQLMMSDVTQRFKQIERLAALEINNLYRPTATLVELLAQQQLISTTLLQQRLHSLPFLTTGLRNQPNISAIYMGFSNGDFFLLRPWRHDTKLIPHFMPPPRTAWIVQSIQKQNNQSLGEYLFFDTTLQLLERRVKPDYRFDPRSRPWYQSALKSNTLVISEPYLFFTSSQPGVSFSQRSDNGQSVAAADIRLETLNTLLRQSKITPNTWLALLNQAGEVFSWHGDMLPLKKTTAGINRLPRLTELSAPILATLQQQAAQSQQRSLSFATNTDTWQGGVVPITVPDGSPLTLLIAAPHSELLRQALDIRDQGFLIATVLLVFGIGLALLLSRLASRPLLALTDEAHKIERFEFDRPLSVNTRILEVAHLACAMARMKSTIQHFLALSRALAGESNFQQLLARLLHEMQQITSAQGGIIYLANPTGLQLQAAQAAWQGTVLVNIATLDSIDLDKHSTHPIATTLQQGGKTLSLSAAMIREYFNGLIPLPGPLTLLILPLNNCGELLGALVLFVDEQQPLTTELLAFAEALSGTAAVALNTQRLINEQKALLESFIQLIAGAIDAKSAYTGGHCQRVPELTKMLARAACTEQQGPFADFNLTEEQWEELHIAAWLHDCGKVTTPEYIVDKATKLETLYDRIHEIRMRFELIKRDAEIICWRTIATGGDASRELAQLHSTLAQLDADYAFVAACNEGNEFMAPQSIARIRQIANRTWMRTLSDRIGISTAEKERKGLSPEPTLPVIEQLLADKPEHIFARYEHDQLSATNPWGFKVTVPDCLYNRGELYNLCVSRGTLSKEERYKINEHIIQTIIMLEKLPFPRHLRRVPEIAGGHHEKMDGTGYPKRLRRGEMSLPARMMAIADIFEALTAADRPYKKGKMLSEALEIMHTMQKEHHIDPDLFALFLRAGVYKDYAEKFIKTEQIDDVDITRYL